MLYVKYSLCKYTLFYGFPAKDGALLWSFTIPSPVAIFDEASMAFEEFNDEMVLPQLLVQATCSP